MKCRFMEYHLVVLRLYDGRTSHDKHSWGFGCRFDRLVCQGAMDNQARVAKEVKETNRDIVNNYIRRDDYKDDISEIKSMLSLIFQKLDGKADK